MSENYSFFNSKDHDRKYNAKDWADYFKPLFKTGVFNGDLQVVADEGMAVKIKPGYAWIDGYAYHLTDELVLDLETASGNMNRIDSIVVRLDLTNRWIKACCKTGNYYANAPTPPVPTMTATIHEIVISHISVPAGTTQITQDLVEDTRMNGDICGWVCGAVEQIDFEQITVQFKSFMEKYESDLNLRFETLQNYETDKKAQFDTFQQELYEKENELHKQHKADIANYFEQLQERGNNELTTLIQQFIDFRNVNEFDFLEWFEKIKGVFSTDAAGKLLLEIDKLTEQVNAIEEMLLLGRVTTKLLTDSGNYITDSIGNPILANKPICTCK